MRLDSIGRATWRVRDVVRYYDAGLIVDSSRPGGVLSLPILRFKVTLESGSTKTDVWVDVTPSGYDQLKQAGHSDEESLKKIVERFRGDPTLSWWNKLLGSDPISTPGTE